MAVRPELVPQLRPSTREYMHRVLNNIDIGIRSARKDFLDKGVTEVTKVTRATGARQRRCQVFYLSNFSPEVQQRLIEVTTKDLKHGQTDTGDGAQTQMTLNPLFTDVEPPRRRPH